MQFQDDFNSLGECEGDDEFVCEWNGDLRNDFCAIDLKVIRAKCWSTWVPSLGVTPTHACEEFFAEETHKVCSMQLLDRRGREGLGIFFETHKSCA